MSQDKRRKWSSADKLRIVIEGLQASVDVAEPRRREGINSMQYNGWKKQLLSSVGKIFENGRKPKQPGEDARKEAKIQRLERVIAEITAVNLELKNALGVEDHGQVPPAFQMKVHLVVEATRQRSGWPATKTLAALGMSRWSYYRWLK